jgi:hypothetical protein
MADYFVCASLTRSATHTHLLCVSLVLLCVLSYTQSHGNHMNRCVLSYTQSHGNHMNRKKFRLDIEKNKRQSKFKFKLNYIYVSKRKTYLRALNKTR